MSVHCRAMLEKGSITDCDRLTFDRVWELAIIIAVIGDISLTAPIMIGIWKRLSFERKRSFECYHGSNDRSLGRMSNRRTTH